MTTRPDIDAHRVQFGQDQFAPSKFDFQYYVGVGRAECDDRARQKGSGDSHSLMAPAPDLGRAVARLL